MDIPFLAQDVPVLQNFFPSDDDDIIENIDDILLLQDLNIMQLFAVNQGVSRIYQKQNPLLEMDEITFRQKFRMTKQTFEVLHGLLSESLAKRRSAIDTKQELLVVLDYFASGVSQTRAGETIGTSTRNVARIIRKVNDALISLRDEYIKLPDEVTTKRVSN